jgi:hypothetical protein
VSFAEVEPAVGDLGDLGAGGEDEPFGVSVRAVVVRAPEQFDDNVEMFEHPIPEALWVDLKSESLLPERVATPAE